MHRHVRRAYASNPVKLNNDAVLELISSAGLRFNRLTDDINQMSSYMRDIRICFIALTILIYCVLIGYFVHLCFVKKRRISGSNARRSRPQWDFPGDINQSSDYRNQTGAVEDLVSVRSDGQVGTGLTANTTTNPLTGIGQPAAYMGRNHRSAAPFMRHGRHMDHQFSRTTATTAQATTGGTSLSGLNATTRLMTSDADRTVIKHQIPHITTSEVSSYEQHQSNGSSNNDEENKSVNNNTAHGMPLRSLHHRQMNHHHQTIVNDTTEM